MAKDTPAEPIHLARWFERFVVAAFIVLITVNGWGARQIYGNGSSIGKLQERSIAQAAEIKKLSEVTTDCWEAIAEARRQIAENITPVWREVADIREHIATLPTREEVPPTLISQQVDRLEQKVDSMSARVEGMTGKVELLIQHYASKRGP